MSQIMNSSVRKCVRAEQYHAEYSPLAPGLYMHAYSLLRGRKCMTVNSAQPHSRAALSVMWEFCSHKVFKTYNFHCLRNTVTVSVRETVQVKWKCGWANERYGCVSFFRITHILQRRHDKWKFNANHTELNFKNFQYFNLYNVI